MVKRPDAFEGGEAIVVIVDNLKSIRVLEVLRHMQSLERSSVILAVGERHMRPHLHMPHIVVSPRREVSPLRLPQIDVEDLMAQIAPTPLPPIDASTLISLMVLQTATDTQIDAQRHDRCHDHPKTAFSPDRGTELRKPFVKPPTYHRPRSR